MLHPNDAIMRRAALLERLAQLYFGALFLLVLTIGLDHLLVPLEHRTPIVRALAGRDYAEIALPSFAAHPRLMNAHAITGLLFVSIAPLQLWQAWRVRHLRLHRALGVVFIANALVAAVTGVWIASTLSLSGRGEPVPNAFFSLLAVVFVARAVRCALRGDFEAHREWMLRVVGVGFGIGLARLYLFGLVHLAGLTSGEAVGQALWLGAGTNLIVMEVWINVSRRLRALPITRRSHERIFTV
jgi:uncharacterized membrane protein